MAVPTCSRFLRCAELFPPPLIRRPSAETGLWGPLLAPAFGELRPIGVAGADGVAGLAGETGVWKTSDCGFWRVGDWALLVGDEPAERRAEAKGEDGEPPAVGEDGATAFELPWEPKDRRDDPLSCSFTRAGGAYCAELAGADCVGLTTCCRAVGEATCCGTKMGLPAVTGCPATARAGSCTGVCGDTTARGAAISGGNSMPAMAHARAVPTTYTIGRV